MILDKTLTFSENQAVTATAISQNVIQMLAMGKVPGDAAVLTRNLGAGNEIPMLIEVTEKFLTLTSLTITIESADNAGLSTNAVVHYSSGAIPVASLVAGYKPAMRWFPDDTIKAFLGLRYTVTGTTATAGKVTAAMATEVGSDWR